MSGNIDEVWEWLGSLPEDGSVRIDSEEQLAAILGSGEPVQCGIDWTESITVVRYLAVLESVDWMIPDGGAL